MKRLFHIILYCWLSLTLYATEKTRSIEIVELDSKLVGIIIPFIEYTSECEYQEKPYSKNNFLDLSLGRPPKILNDSAEKILCIDFYPDDEDINKCHLYEIPQYIAYIHLGDSVYNVFISMDEEVKHKWSKYQNLGIFTPTGNYSAFISAEAFLQEYDPPFVRMWYITSPHEENKHGYYVEWSVSHYCW